MRDVVIMRGLPGSGKSTLAKQIATMVEEAVIVSADSYFPNEVVNTSALQYAHLYCQQCFEEALKDGAPLVIVDNTNTCKADIQIYMDMAAEYTYAAMIIEVPCDIETSLARNIHGAPREHIEQMANRMRTSPLDPSWKIQRYGG